MMWVKVGTIVPLSVTSSHKVIIPPTNVSFLYGGVSLIGIVSGGVYFIPYP